MENDMTEEKSSATCGGGHLICIMNWNVFNWMCCMAVTVCVCVRSKQVRLQIDALLYQCTVRKKKLRRSKHNADQESLVLCPIFPKKPPDFPCRWMPELPSVHRTGVYNLLVVMSLPGISTWLLRFYTIKGVMGLLADSEWLRCYCISVCRTDSPPNTRKCILFCLMVV